MVYGWLDRYMCLRPIRPKLLWTTSLIIACNSCNVSKYVQILADVVWILLRRYGGEIIIIWWCFTWDYDDGNWKSEFIYVCLRNGLFEWGFRVWVLWKYRQKSLKPAKTLQQTNMAQVPCSKLITNLASSSRTGAGNTGPRSFLYGPRCARS